MASKTLVSNGRNTFFFSFNFICFPIVAPFRRRPLRRRPQPHGEGRRRTEARPTRHGLVRRAQAGHPRVGRPQACEEGVHRRTRKQVWHITNGNLYSLFASVCTFAGPARFPALAPQRSKQGQNLSSRVLTPCELKKIETTVNLWVLLWNCYDNFFSCWRDLHVDAGVKLEISCSTFDVKCSDGNSVTLTVAGTQHSKDYCDPSNVPGTITVSSPTNSITVWLDYNTFGNPAGSMECS